MSTWAPPEPTVFHPDAAWAELADDRLVSAFFAAGVVGWEEIPVRRLIPTDHFPAEFAGLYEVCCISFFSDWDDLGSIVVTRPEAPALIAEIWDTSSRIAYRLEIVDAGKVARVERVCREEGWLFERGSDRFCLSVDHDADQPVSRYLEARVADGVLRWLS